MLGRKVVLALVSVVLTLALLELAADRFVRSMGPVKVRDGLYANPLPLITGVGGPPVALEFLPSGERLPIEKHEGELRIAVLGESSVEGSPFDVEVSFPAMMLDDLRRSFPDRSLTVLNMGRPGSVSANIYYYLIYLRKYKPDYIVFYMGMNDSPFMPGESCAIGASPRGHAAWRTLVEHSSLLWLARVYGPQYVWKLAGRSSWYPPRDCSVPTFSLWTRLLTRFARESGARVVIANPVKSVIVELESEDFERRSTFPRKSPEYLRLLACSLTPECDLHARLLEQVRKPTLGFLPSRLWNHKVDLAWRAAAWREAALAYGASVIEFERFLESVSPHGLLGSAFFADRQHLTPPGYLLLARVVSERLRTILSGLPERAVALPVPADLRPYLDATHSSGLGVIFDQFRRGHALALVQGLLYPLEAFGANGSCDPRFCAELEHARLTLGWLRTLAGLDHGLPPDKARGLVDFNVMVEKYPQTSL